MVAQQNTPNQYFLRRGDKVQGPFPSRKISELAQSNALLPSDELRKDGSTQWVPISQVKGLLRPAAVNNTTVGNTHTAREPEQSIPKQPWWKKIFGAKKPVSTPAPALPVVVSTPVPASPEPSKALVENNNYYRPYHDAQGQVTGGLLAVNGNMREAILRQFNQNFQINGSHIANGGAVAPSSILALIGSAGAAMGASSITSGTLFVATANPATLMSIGGGVGSAVMGAGGIVSQAPFLPAAAGLMPVIAPLMAFQAISSIMQLQKFAKIQQQLNKIERNINRLIQRTEASVIGEVISSCARIEELESELVRTKTFTTDMKVRLALVCDKVNPIFERYRQLFGSRRLDDSINEDDLGFQQNDAYFAVVLSILDLRVDVLRLQLAVQDSPALMAVASERLQEKANSYKDLWREVAEMKNVAKEVANDLRESSEQMNWFNKNLFKRNEFQTKQAQVQALENHVDALETAGVEHIELARKYSSTLQLTMAPTAPMNLVYWKDEAGEHAYYTSELEFASATRK